MCYLVYNKIKQKDRFMPKINTRLNSVELEYQVRYFLNQMVFLRLVNSGTSYPDSKRNEFTKSAFSTAYIILSDVFAKKNIKLFNRIFTATKELVQGPYTTPEMENLQNNFYSKTSNFVQKIAEYLASIKNVR